MIAAIDACVCWHLSGTEKQCFFYLCLPSPRQLLSHARLFFASFPHGTNVTFGKTAACCSHFHPLFAFTSLSVSLLECCHSVSRKAQSGPGTSHRQKLVNRGAAARTIQPSTNRTSLSPAQMVPSGSAPRSAPASSVRPSPATLLPPLPGHPLPTPWLPTAHPLATWRKQR